MSLLPGLDLEGIRFISHLEDQFDGSSFKKYGKNGRKNSSNQSTFVTVDAPL